MSGLLRKKRMMLIRGFRSRYTLYLHYITLAVSSATKLCVSVCVFVLEAREKAEFFQVLNLSH